MYGKTSILRREDGSFHFKFIHIPKSCVQPFNFPGKPKMRSQFDYHPDEFGRHVTVISPERGTRQFPSKKVGSLDETRSFEDYNEYLRLFLASRKEYEKSLEGFGLNEAAFKVAKKEYEDFHFERRLHIARLTNGPYFLQYILQNEKNAQILKAASENYFSPKEFRKYGCVFCRPEEWGEPRGIPRGSKIGFVANPYRYAPHHEIHIIAEPIHNIDEMLESKAYAVDFMKLAFMRAEKVYSRYSKVIRNMFWGMNYGTGRIEKGEENHTSFATFQHIHAQLNSIPKGVTDPGAKITLAIKNKEFNTNFFKAYIEALYNSDLVIKKYHKGFAYLVVPWAQESRHHIRIIAAVPNFCSAGKNENLLEEVGKAFYDGLLALHTLDIRTFNCISFPGPMSSKEQKLIIDLIPKARPAMQELAGFFIVDEDPVVTADRVREILFKK